MRNECSYPSNKKTLKRSSLIQIKMYIEHSPQTKEPLKHLQATIYPEKVKNSGLKLF